jgi:hypothetical protein
MSDDIIIWSKDMSKHIFVRNLIAFIPDCGYIIFEGYAHIKKEDLPCKITINRFVPCCQICGVFDADIIKIYKKDLQSFKRLDSGDGCTDDDCRISFFSTDIIIFKINNVKSDNINYDYCIDNRFNNMSELIDRYTNLLDVPDDMYESYLPRESDREFYEELHKLMNEA